MNNKIFYNVNDIMNLLSVSRSEAYKIIRKLNSEIEDKGFLVISGRISCKYFKERFYDCSA